MGVFDDDILTAQQEIQENGQLVIVREPVDGTLADATKPWKKTAGTPIDTNVYMCFFNETRKDQEPQIREYESLVGDGLLYGLMAYKAGLVVSLKHLVVRGSTIYKIRYVRPLNVNGEEIMTKIGLRV